MRSAGLIAAVVVFTSSAFAAVIRVPSDYPTIQEAVAAAADYDVISVAPGTYNENVSVLGKSLTIESEQGASVTAIDGGGGEFGVCVEEAAFFTLEGFRITNAESGVLCEHSTQVTIKRNILTANERGLDVDWHGVGADSAAVENYIHHNQTGISWRRAPGLIADNVIAHNKRTGVFASDSHVTISRNMIEYNQLGGVRVSHSDAEGHSITHNVIRGNTTTENGGGIDCSHSTGVIKDNVITGNTAFLGGGICLSDSEAAVMNNLIAGNTGSGLGGGIYCWSSLDTIEGNRIIGNSAPFGGGVLLEMAHPTLANNIIAHNTADDAGLSIRVSSAPALINNTIANNVFSASGAELSCKDSDPTVANTILWNGGSPAKYSAYVDSRSSLTISHSDVQGGAGSVYVEPGGTLNWGAGMIDADPLFAGFAEDDLHLGWASPCIGAGDSAAASGFTSDFEGDPREAGLAVDIGADEYFFHLYYLGDAAPGSTIDVKAIGGPGMPVRLALGSDVLETPQPTPYGDLYIPRPPLAANVIGAIPANGVLSYTLTLPAWWQSGQEKPFQALVGPVGGPSTRLTNLMLLQVE